MKLLLESPLRFLSATLLFAIVTHFLVILNPGFFNHDEWQRYDHIYSYDFAHFVQKVGVLKAGKEFGAPVRPLGFIQQGFSALFMVSHPWVGHFIDVLIHFFDVMAFYYLLGRFPVPIKTKNIAALLFVISPLGVFSTAWVGASFDRLYVLFSMTAAYFSVGIYQHKKIHLNSVGLLISACLAMTSKETALMLPAFISLGYMAAKLQNNKLVALLKDRYFYLVCVLAGLPILIFLIIRFSALYNTLFVYASPEYSPKLSFFLRNVTYYLAYPFYFGSADMYTMMFENKTAVMFALGLHLLLMVIIGLTFSLRVLFAYLGFYFIFLLPVIFVSSIAAHYLYSTAPVMSLALAYLMTANNRFAFWFCIGLVLLSLFRFAQIQTIFYEDGICQSRSIATLDKALSDARKLHDIKTVNIWGGQGVKTYVAMRTLFGRSKNGPYKGLAFSSESPGSSSYDLSLEMNKSCELYVKK